MKKVMITGSLGQIGSELVKQLRIDYGVDNIIATDIHQPVGNPIVEEGPFAQLDVMDQDKMIALAKKYEVDTLIHLAALLSATGEKKPQFAWELNMTGLMHALETARMLNLKLFTPSSIAAFGPDSPKDNTPQTTIQRPTTMYGISKVAGELLCDYYHQKFGVDTRGLRFPGLISHLTEPGGGTTDYAVDIYYAALRYGKYTSFIGRGTYMDMMYMPDAIAAIIALMEADGSGLKHRNAFNITAMSFAPEEISASIKKAMPSFEMTYKVDPMRQAIADSWPNAIDATAAKAEWGFSPKYDLDKMTVDMLEKLAVKLNLPTKNWTTPCQVDR